MLNLKKYLKRGKGVAAAAFAVFLVIGALGWALVFGCLLVGLMILERSLNRERRNETGKKPGKGPG